MPDDAIERARQAMTKLPDPNDPCYERARVAMAARLSAIGRNEPKSGYSRKADDLLNGDLMEVPTWMALGMLAFASQQAPEGWRPIEQLPDEMKDGRKFMVYDGQGGYDFASWHRDHVCGDNDGRAPFTHFRPLPAPPAMLDAAPSVGEGV